MSASDKIVLTEQETLEIEAAWKRESLDRCKAFDEGLLTERDVVDVLKDAYSAAGLRAGKTV